MLERSASSDSNEYHCLSGRGLTEPSSWPRHLGAADGGGKPYSRRSPIGHAHFRPATKPGAASVCTSIHPHRFDPPLRKYSALLKLRGAPVASFPDEDPIKISMAVY